MSGEGHGVVIAIDGPAGSGKSTVARLVAEELDFALVDTGAMYRAVTLEAIERGVSLDDADALGELAADVRLLFRSEAGEAGTRFFLGERDITEEIRTLEVGRAVSPVSVHPAVRKEMVELQRESVGGLNAVVEGRDIGTVVFPNAALKVYLEAGAEERVRRRQKELDDKGLETGVDDVASEVATRDAVDSSREASPLRTPEDAVVVDTTSMGVEEVVSTVLREADARGLKQ